MSAIQYVVFAPLAPLSRTRWNYFQHQDGKITRTITSKSGRQSDPDELWSSEVFPDALSWARCLHAPSTVFQDCPEAKEIYSTLCNVVRHVKDGGPYDDMGARICLEGIIDDCQEWLRQLEKEKFTASQAHRKAGGG